MMRKTILKIVCATFFLYRIPIPIIKAIKLQDGYWDPLCPRCGNAIDREFTLYCSCCGQRLNWFLWDEFIEEVSPEFLSFYKCRYCSCIKQYCAFIINITIKTLCKSNSSSR